MDKRIFTGKSLDEVLSQATRAFGTDPSQLKYEVLSSSAGQGGLLSKFFNRNVKIEAWVEDSILDLKQAARDAVNEALSFDNPVDPLRIKPQEKNQNQPQKGARPAKNHESFPRDEQNGFNPRKNQPQKPHSSPTSEPDSQPSGLSFHDPRAVDTLTEIANRFVEAFSDTIPATLPTIEVLPTGDAKVRLVEPYLEGVLTRSDKISSSFEHIVKRICQKKFGDVSSRVSLVAGDSETMKIERLTALAISMAKKVKATGETVALGSRSSQERRVIHLTLDNFEGVGTRSVGNGENRKLIIFSTSKNGKESSQGNSSAEKKHRPQNNLNPQRKPDGGAGGKPRTGGAGGGHRSRRPGPKNVAKPTGAEGSDSESGPENVSIPPEFNPISVTSETSVVS